jgi:Ca2+-binding RTX toxin-like protein
MPLATPVNAEDYTVTIQPEGTDTIVAGDGSDTVIAGYGTDAVTLSGWTNQVIGGLGQDVVTGAAITPTASRISQPRVRRWRWTSPISR